MAKVFDEADYQRRLDAAQNDISFSEELRLVTRDVLHHGYFQELRARKNIQNAKVNALRKARKAMLKRIEQERQSVRDRAILPIDVTETAFGKSDDQLVSVDGEVTG